MKKIYWIALVMIIASITIFAFSAKDYTTYSSFAEAEKVDSNVKIVGQLSKDKEIYYNPEKDPNYFSFYIRDNNNEERKVILKSHKPQDFERSESIVLTGKMDGDEFIASDMLMKCPSKYKDEEVYLKGEQG